MALEQVRTVVLVGKSTGVFQVGNIPNRGTFCAGRILRGTVKIGDQVKYATVMITVVISSSRAVKCTGLPLVGRGISPG